MNTRSRFLLWSATAVALGAAFLGARSSAGEDDEGDAATLKSLSTAKHTLAEGISQSAKSPGVAISAKFEDEGKGLSLSVYVAAKGLGTEADENVLQELAGSPTGAEWKPETEVFKDVGHVARSAEQLTLMRLTPLTLADAISKVEKSQKGTVFSVTPEVRGKKAVFEVKVADGGKATEVLLDLMTGAPVVEVDK